MASNRAREHLEWALETFGEIALDPEERALRFIEEAVELVHAMGLKCSTLSTLVERVYAKPSGDLKREMGQAFATLEILSIVVGVNAQVEARSELERVKAIPKKVWVERHAAKVKLGVARWEATDELA